MSKVIHTTQMDSLLSQYLEEYSRSKNKTINYTDTYSRKYLLECISDMTDRIMYKHCIEDRVIMAEMDEEYWEWLDKNADRLAAEDEEYKHNNCEKDGV